MSKICKNNKTKKENRYPIASQEFALRMVDHVLDNVYGHIGITKTEKEIELLPIFKRLHNISQLGLVHWIFPCAVHTRYVHSLGVMQMAYEMAKHINENYLKVNRLNESFFSDSDLQIIRLAGMLHDIGHYPLSHNVEAAYKEGVVEYGSSNKKYVVECQKELVGCPKYLQVSEDEKSLFRKTIQDLEKDNREDYLKEWRGSQGYHHEAIGRAIIQNNTEIHNVIRDNFVLLDIGGKTYINPALAPIQTKDDDVDADEITNALVNMIASIVIGDYAYEQTPIYRFQQKYSAIVQIIHSEMDADNLDYLLRDATFSGTSYGLMDVGILLNCLTVSEIKRENLDGRLGEDAYYLVGVLPKGIGCVEQFFTNKYLAYSQMIYSKYASCLEAMLLNWAKHTLPHDADYGLELESGEDDVDCGIESESGEDEKSELFLSLVNSRDTQAKYLHFTDAFIQQRIYRDFLDQSKGQKSLSSRPSLIRRAILSRLVNYKSFELYDSSEFLCVGFGEEDIRNKMKKISLYKEYSDVIKQLGGMTLDELHKTSFEEEQENNSERKLLEFRFENYTMTKQIPFSEFERSVAPPEHGQMVFKHYYRLANGVPILPPDHSGTYRIVTDEGKIRRELIPELIVDSDASGLNKTWNQKMVFLRKYRIEDTKSK